MRSTDEPTMTDLSVIADEWTVIEAELAVVTAECRLAAAPGELAVRAHRRAVAELATVTRKEAAARVAVVKVRRPADVARSARPLTAVAPAPVAA